MLATQPRHVDLQAKTDRSAGLQAKLEQVGNEREVGGVLIREVSSIAELPRVLQLLETKDNVRIVFKQTPGVSDDDAKAAKDFILGLPEDLSRARADLKVLFQTHAQLLENGPYSITSADAAALLAKYDQDRGTTPERKLSKEIPLDLSRPAATPAPLVDRTGLTPQGRQLLDVLKLSQGAPDTNPPAIKIELPSDQAARDALLAQLGAALQLDDPSKSPADLGAKLAKVKFVAKSGTAPDAEPQVVANAWGANEGEGIWAGAKMMHDFLEAEKTPGRKTLKLFQSRLAREDSASFEGVKEAVKKKLLGDESTAGLAAVSDEKTLLQMFPGPEDKRTALKDEGKRKAYTDARDQLKQTVESGTATEKDVREKLGALDTALEGLGLPPDHPARARVRGMANDAAFFERQTADFAKAKALVQGGLPDPDTLNESKLKELVRTHGGDESKVTTATHDAFVKALKTLRQTSETPLATPAERDNFQRALEECGTQCLAIGLKSDSAPTKDFDALHGLTERAARDEELRHETVGMLGRKLMWGVRDVDALRSHLFESPPRQPPAEFEAGGGQKIVDAVKELAGAIRAGGPAEVRDALVKLCQACDDSGMKDDNLRKTAYSLSKGANVLVEIDGRIAALERTTTSP